MSASLPRVWKYVYSTEVEQALAAHPAVAQVAVIGVPDETWGEAVHAVVVLAPGAVASESELIDHARGLKRDVIAHLGTQEFKRVRIGVGEKPKDYDLAAYVLGHFTQEDRKKVEEAIAQAADAVELMVQERTDEAMNLYNKKKHE